MNKTWIEIINSKEMKEGCDRFEKKYCSGKVEVEDEIFSF